MLVISDDEHNVGDNEVASSDVAEVRERENARENSGDADPVSRPRFPGDGELDNSLF